MLKRLSLKEFLIKISICAVAFVLSIVVVLYLRSPASAVFDLLIYKTGRYTPTLDRVYIPIAIKFPFDVVLSIMIPVCISTLSKGDEGIRTRMRAAALGCMSGMAFVFAYIFAHPYIIDSISGLDAVASFEVACVAIVSTWVTLRLLRNDEAPYFIGTIRGINIDRGLLRAYVAIGIPLIFWSMYEFHAAKKAVLYSQKCLYTYSDIVNKKFDKNFIPDESEIKKNEILGALRSEFLIYDIKDADEFYDVLKKQDNEAQDDLTASIYRLLVILFPLGFYPVLVWILKGFGLPVRTSDETIE